MLATSFYHSLTFNDGWTASMHTWFASAVLRVCLGVCRQLQHIGKLWSLRNYIFIHLTASETIVAVYIKLVNAQLNGNSPDGLLVSNHLLYFLRTDQATLVNKYEPNGQIYYFITCTSTKIHLLLILNISFIRSHALSLVLQGIMSTWIWVIACWSMSTIGDKRTWSDIPF